jgi:hypothetical protein
MYLTRLYRYNKWLFIAIIFFAVMQLFVTYKRGMLISPWYNYGMYSEKMHPKKGYEVNKALGGPAWLYVISPQYDDKINVTIDNHKNLAQNDSLYKKEIARLFAKFHLPVPNPKFYKSSFSQQQFTKWFNEFWWASKLVQQKPTTKHAIWDGNNLIIP